MATKVRALATAKPDLDTLRGLAESDLAEAERHAALAVVYAARAGGRFLVMKTIVEGTRGYGSWGTWVAANVQLSARSVQFYMQLARTLPALADPDADPESVLAESAPARELAGLSLRKAMQKLGEANARGPRELPAPKADEPPPDPRPIVQEWALKQLPLIADEDRAALVDVWLKAKVADPLDGETFELLCEAFALGHRAAPKPARSRRR